MATDDWNALAGTLAADSGSATLAPPQRRRQQPLGRPVASPNHAGRVLKTDLFDEAVGEGVYPALATLCQMGSSASTCRRQSSRPPGARHPGVVGVSAEVRMLPFEDEEFGAVFSNSTLDHFDSPERHRHRAARMPACPPARRPVDRDARQSVEPGDRAEQEPCHGSNEPALAAAANRQRESAPAVSRRRDARHHPVARRAHGPRLPRPRDRCDHPRPTRRRRPRCWSCSNTGRAIAAQQRFLEALMRCEVLSRFPTRFFTGHFVGARAIKPTVDHPHDARRRRRCGHRRARRSRARSHGSRPPSRVEVVERDEDVLSRAQGYNVALRPRGGHGGAARARPGSRDRTRSPGPVPEVFIYAFLLARCSTGSSQPALSLDRALTTVPRARLRKLLLETLPPQTVSWNARAVGLHSGRGAGRDATAEDGRVRAGDLAGGL